MPRTVEIVKLASIVCANARKVLMLNVVRDNVLISRMILRHINDDGFPRRVVLHATPRLAQLRLKRPYVHVAGFVEPLAVGF